MSDERSAGHTPSVYARPRRTSGLREAGPDHCRGWDAVGPCPGLGCSSAASGRSRADRPCVQPRVRPASRWRRGKSAADPVSAERGTVERPARAGGVAWRWSAPRPRSNLRCGARVLRQGPPRGRTGPPLFHVERAAPGLLAGALGERLRRRFVWCGVHRSVRPKRRPAGRVRGWIGGRQLRPTSSPLVRVPPGPRVSPCAAVPAAPPRTGHRRLRLERVASEPGSFQRSLRSGDRDVRHDRTLVDPTLRRSASAPVPQSSGDAGAACDARAACHGGRSGTGAPCATLSRRSGPTHEGHRTDDLLGRSRPFHVERGSHNRPAFHVERREPSVEPTCQAAKSGARAAPDRRRALGPGVRC
jgi:hypothetical protein